MGGCFGVEVCSRATMRLTTEARIAGALRDARAGRTTVVLTSSPLMLDRADVVVLVVDGVVAATGRHRALLRDDAMYRAVVTREEVTTP